MPTHAWSLEILLLFPGPRDPLSFPHEPWISSIVRDPPPLCSLASPRFTSLRAAPTLSVLAGSRAVSPGPRPSAVPRAPRGPLRSPCERPLRSARWGWWDRAEIAWGLSRRWGLCHRTRRFLLLLPLSLPFQPAVSLNCRRRAPIGRTRVRRRPALEGSGAFPCGDLSGLETVRPASVTVPRSVQLSGW